MSYISFGQCFRNTSTFVQGMIPQGASLPSEGGLPREWSLRELLRDGDVPLRAFGLSCGALWGFSGVQMLFQNGSEGETFSEQRARVTYGLLLVSGAVASLAAVIFCQRSGA